MGLSVAVEKMFRWWLPSPFTIAVLLTLLTYALALWATPEPVTWTKAGNLLRFWDEGLWNNALLGFAVQMMLMLVLGHVLALTKLFDRLICFVTRYCTTTAPAAALVTVLTVAVGLFNWGFALIFGAIFARKIAENALTGGYQLNYPLIGAAGYSGLMVWHGGLSGSSLAKVAEPGHLPALMEGILPQAGTETLPAMVGFDATVFSTMNVSVSIAVLIVLPLAMYWLGKRVGNEPIRLSTQMQGGETESKARAVGAERIERSRWFSLAFGTAVLGYALCKAATMPGGVLAFFNPNNINLLLLGPGLILHQSFRAFLKAVDQAISGVSGILIQFPLYFGIMGMMRSSGLASQISDYFVSISNEMTYPVFTFLSAGLVNIFVPSGGGQWAVQGPVIVQAAQQLGVSLSKCIMAFAYGDQLTNMLQPFWALPLLGITGLKARDILPYTLYLMLIGTVIYLSALLLF